MAIFNWQTTRRKLLAGGPVAAALGSLRLPQLFAASEAKKSAAAKAPDIYARLGVRTRINAKGTYTYLTGSLVPPEVTRA
ncbi:MAG: selenocysteine synthase, partial [Terriglobia bacterium]